MSARAHPRAVGAFVLGAVALVLAAVVLLAAGDRLAPKDRFVVFFPGSVRGLNPGAPITFRGVRTGEVKEVTALLSGRPSDPIQIEVVIELRRNVVEPLPGADTTWRNVRGAELARQLIATGIRGRLLSQSLLTGQKYIEFEFLPDEPARLSGLSRRYPELPTAPSAMERLGERSEAIIDKIAELPFDRMLEDLRDALQSLHTLLDSRDLKGALAGARRSSEAIPPALDEVRAASRDARRLLAAVEQDLHATGGEATETARRLRATLDRLDRTLGHVDDATASSDDARVQAVRTLQDLSRTLSALRQLAEYLETHPESLLQGKPAPEATK